MLRSETCVLAGPTGIHWMPKHVPKLFGMSNRQNGGKKGPGDRSNLKKTSHALSWALRHSAPDIGLTMTPDGYVPVAEFLNSQHPRFKRITMEAIVEVVETSDKKRFALCQKPRSNFYQDGKEDEDIMCIRANQGHSIKSIDPNLLLTKLTPDEVRSLPCIVHGTYMENWKPIAEEGLKKMTRTHIHFAKGLPGDNEVISGMRKSCTVYIFLDPALCAQDEIPFFLSQNGVVLTEGIDGVLPPKYFSRVTDSSGKVLLGGP